MVVMHVSFHGTHAYLSLNFAIPKSHTLARPKLSRRTLDDFRSLHTRNVVRLGCMTV